ncbi:MAG: glycine cleavage T C-terminal barrel domain-containing protein [Acidimicrobiales bacterium]
MTIEEDYELLRTGVAAVPVRRDVIQLSGKDAVSFLQGQCTQDIAPLGIGDSRDSLILEPRGFIDAQVRVTRTGDDELVLDTQGGWGQKVIERLERFKLRVKVEITGLDWECVALRGPSASDPSVIDGATGVVLSLDASWPGLNGVDLLGPEIAAPPGIKTCSADAWKAVRIEAGIPQMGTEISEKTIPAEAGLVERCVSFTKGCFTGQELVARLDSRGSNVARRLCGLVIADHVALPEESDLTSNDGSAKSVGRVTLVGWSPGLNATVALAYVHRSVEAGSTVRAGNYEAEVRPLPLVG